MASSSVFVGVVTHPRSRFHANGTHTATALVESLKELGVNADLLISDRNDYDPAVMGIDRSVLARSAIHQADLEHRWRRYLAAGGAAAARSGVADRFARAGMALKRLASRDSAAAIRLLNIDLSHLRLMEAAVGSGATWSLILEDDAGTSDARNTAETVNGLIAAMDTTDVRFVNLSESLSFEELGVAGLLAPAVDIPSVGPQLLRAIRPVTNTVCATLYRTSYLAVLRASIVHRGLVPIAPIDWRVNEVVMDLFDQGVLDSGSCVWVQPGVFVQQSMHGKP